MCEAEKGKRLRGVEQREGRDVRGVEQREGRGVRVWFPNSKQIFKKYLFSKEK